MPPPFTDPVPVPVPAPAFFPAAPAPPTGAAFLPPAAVPGRPPGGAVIGLGACGCCRLRTTVPVLLASLDSLAPLARLVADAAVVGLGGAAAAARVELVAAETVAPRLRRAAAAAAAAAAAVVEVEVVVRVLRAGVGAPPRTEREPSTILLRVLEAAVVARPGVTAGRMMPDRAGVAAVVLVVVVVLLLPAAVVGRGPTRELEVVGDRTWDAALRDMSETVLARIFFCGVCMSFSLSPLVPVISWLGGRRLARGGRKGRMAGTNLSLFTGRPEGGAMAPRVGGRDGGRDGALSFAGTGGPLAVFVAEAVAPGFCCSCSWEHLSSSSPMVSRRSDRGMRLTRISMRVLRLCAWML